MTTATQPVSFPVQIIRAALVGGVILGVWCFALAGILAANYDGYGDWHIFDLSVAGLVTTSLSLAGVAVFVVVRILTRRRQRHETSVS